MSTLACITKLFLIILLVCCCPPSKAQFVAIDPGDIAATIANGGILTKTNEVIKEANEITSDIRGSDQLGISNIAFEIDATAQISTH